MNNENVVNMESIKAMREKVESRKKEESQKKSNEPPDEIDSDFIWECFEANEVGDSMLYNALHRGQFVHNSDTKGEWYCFENHSWELDKTGRALAAVENVVALYLQEAAQLKEKIDEAIKEENDKRVKYFRGLVKAFKARANKLRTVRGRENCLKAAATNNEPIVISYDELDQRPMLFACENGVVELATGLLKDGDPEDYITKASPIEFKGLDEPCPKWEEFFSDCIENEEVIHYLHKVLGYAITGEDTVRIFPVFWGERGQNGKGTIMDMIFHILGPLAGPIQSEMLTAQLKSKSSSGPSPDIMALKGKRIVWGSETEEGQRFAAAKVKLLTGGDPLVGRNPNDRHQTTFLPTHTLFLLTNEKPHAPPQDNAFWMRQKLIEFPYTYVDFEPEKTWEKKAAPGLKNELKKEASGILAWLVRGCLLWQKEGLQVPDKVKKDTVDYRRAEDQIADFVEQCCELNPDEKAMASDLYAVFKVWWKECVTPKPLSQRKFGDMMTLRFEKGKPRGVVEYYGLEIMSTKYSTTAGIFRQERSVED